MPGNPHVRFDEGRVGRHLGARPLSYSTVSAVSYSYRWLRPPRITMDVDTMSDIPALLERFRRGPELLAVVLTGVFGEEEDFLAAPGKWSIRQIVAHLADAEMVGAHRFRQVVAEDSPTRSEERRVGK